jgi:phosphoglycolate phosphatase-like HAD superfamily hydrolase
VGRSGCANVPRRLSNLLTIWLIDDTPRDLAAAKVNSVRCALVCTGTFGFDELCELGADLVVADLSDPTSLSDAMASQR